MKKVFLVALMVASIAAVQSFAQETVQRGTVQIMPKIGLDFPGTMKLSDGISTDLDTHTGITLGVDALYTMSGYVDIGAGIQYQLHRGMENRVVNTDAAFGFVPLYATILVFPVQHTMQYNPFARLDLGYNFLTANDDFSGGADKKGGFYWGLGAGVQFHPRMQLELLYTVNKGQLSQGGVSADLTYSKISLNLGYLFDIQRNR